MKKKVKKIPKYSSGTISADVLDKAMAGKFKTPIVGSTQTKPMVSLSQHSRAIGGAAAGESGSSISLPGGIATASNEILTNTLGIEDNSKAGVTLNAAAQGADIGGSIMPGWGHLIGGVAGGLMGAFKQGSVDQNTGEITSGGIFGRSMNSLRRESNRIKNSNQAVQQTLNLQADYYNNPNVVIQPNVLAAEGGIMRQPVDALVSKGELIYNPITKKLSKVPGSKGKPNKKDDVYARLSEGDVVISNSPTMIMANGKTPAQNLEGLVDSDKNVKAKEAIIKKVVNWQEAHKIKTPDVPEYENGTSYVQLGKDPFLELEKNLFKPIKAEITGNDPLKNLTNDQRIALRKAINDLNGKKKGNWLSTLSDYAPLASALLHKPSYHKELAYINPVKYVPTGVSIDPIRRATDEGMAIARYNQMNINPSTGAGMAAGLQAAVNRSKSIADAYKWQQDAQNKLIAQNVGIYNDWAAREAQARHTANTETQQNEAAARLMRDQAIKDAYEFQTGRRNDRWKLSMLEPMFKYAVDDNIWKKFAV